LHFQCFEHGDNNYIQCEYHSSKRLNENNWTREVWGLFI
jgi:hypothetical protein